MKSKLIIVFTVIILTVTIFLLVGLHNSTKKEVVQRFQSRQLFTARQLSKELESCLRDEARAVEILSSLPALQNKEMDAVVDVVQEYFEYLKKDHVKSINIHDEKGTIIYSTLRDAVSFDHSDTKFFAWAVQRKNKGELFITAEVPFMFSKSSKNSTFQVMIVAPIYGESTPVVSSSINPLHKEFSDKFVGIVSVTVDLDEILTSFFRADSSHKSKQDAWLLDKDGTVLYQAEHPEMIMFNVHQQDESCLECHDSFKYVESILSQTTGLTEYQLKESPQKLSSFVTLNFKNISWKVVVNTPLDEVTNFVDKNSNQTLALIAVISLILIGSSFSLSRSNRLKVSAQEVTKHLREKEELKIELLESEEHYKTVVNNSPDAIIIHCEGKIVFVNPATVKLVGATSPNDLLGKSAIEFVHPDERESIGKRILEILKSGKISPWLEERFIKMDGSIIIAEVESTPTTFKGKPSVQVIIHDITERKRSDLERQVMYEITEGVTTTSNLDELLKLIHQSLKEVLYAENIFITLHDPNTGLFSFPYFVDNFDPTPEPVAMSKSCTAYVFRTGKPLLLTQELFDQLEKRNEVELVGTNSPSWIGVPLDTPERTIGVLVLQHYEEENIYSERDSEFLTSIGNQIAFAIDRKRAEEAIKREMDFSQGSLDSLPALFYLFDQQGKFLRWNKRFEKATGYSAEEIPNLSPLNLFDEPDKTSVAKKIQETFQIGEAVVEAVLISKDKTKTATFFTGKRFQFEGVECLVGMGIDISDRKFAEERLRKERLLLRTVIDNIPDSIYCKDTAGRKTLANTTELLYSGVKSEKDILGKTDFDFYPKELAEGFFSDDQLVIQSGQPILNREEYLLDEKGEKQWLLTSKIPLKDEKGIILGLVGVGRNITTRKRAEEALRENEVKLNVILQSTADGILAVDGNGKVIKTNGRFAQLWNIPQSLIDSGDDNVLLDFILDQLVNSEDFISKVKKLYNSTEEDLDMLLFKDGRIFERYSAPLIMSDTSIGRVWSFRDITEHKHAEGSLQKERLLLRTVIDNIPDSIYCKDIAGRKTLANLTELRYSGAKSEAEILGKTDFDFYPKELAEGFFADDQFVMQTGQPVLNREEYVIDEKGQKQWLLTSKLPLEDEKGNMLGMVGIGRNITARKRVEESLKESERFLKETQIIAKLGTYSLDIASGKWESSEILNSIFGIASDYDKSVEGWTSLIHPEWQKIMADYFTQEVIGKKSKFDKEYKIVRRNDKSEHWVHGIGELKFDENNQPITMIGTIRDITERKQAEEDIKLKTEQLQKTNSEKDKFFSIIAHDLRSPFSGFLNLTELMSLGSEDFSKDELMKLSISMHESASTVFKLLENLLEWAQMQKGIISFTPGELLLSKAVSFSINTINQRALQKGITIINEVDETQKVFADEKMINTVLRNFLSNAVKFTGRDGKIIVRTKNLDNEMVEVSISDTGVGMTEKDVKKLFKMEEKVSSKGTEGEPSTGLGLLLCKEFVEKNGGKIWAESEKEKGSIFYFTVPECNNKNI